MSTKVQQRKLEWDPQSRNMQQPSLEEVNLVNIL